MTLSSFLTRCDQYSARVGMSRARLSTILFGSGVTLDRLNGGHSVTLRVLERAIGRLDARIAERPESEDQAA
ncbi:MAG: hypothetical protein JWP35_4651 [Caulobacter sp.]|nr:hypothetical protein [Caulobacter sp.]